MKACPYRADFYDKLAGGKDEDEKMMQQLVEWLVAFEKIVAILVAFYASEKYDKGL
jgi:hypothetical protein